MSMILRLFAGGFIKQILYGLLATVVITSGVVFFNKVKSQGALIASLRAEAVIARSNYIEAAESHSRREKQLLSTIETIRQTTTRRTAENKALQDTLSTLREQTNEHTEENKSCPIHPSIEFALDGLRK